MVNRGLETMIVVAVCALAFVSDAAPASDMTDVVELIATRLERSQVQEGPDLGLWASEELLMGPTTAGMACAYEWTGDAVYKIAATWGGYYLLRMADMQGNLLGDEAYAMVRLSEIYDMPRPPIRGTDVWRSALAEFYSGMRRPDYEGSAAAYILYFDAMEPSTRVFYLAHHAIAADYADDIEKAVWRDALVRTLAQVDDTCSFPVMALGVATWALASTGELDDTPVAADAAAAYWEGVTLSDLPAVLLSHQVPEGEPFAGSFFWRLDHTSGPVQGATAGYTEDTIYGTLGLVGAASLEGSPLTSELDRAITAAGDALLQGVDAEGRVYEHLSLQGQTYHAFAGEMLQVLWAVKQYSDSTAEVAGDE